MPCQMIIPVSDASQIGEARRTVARLSNEAQFNSDSQGRLAIIATELATNLVRHAGQGKLLIQKLETGASSCIELISIDSGPGIANVPKAMTDGYSTAGTPGNGLGAILRLSDEFDIYSQPDRGVVVLSRVTRETPVLYVKPTVVWGGISIPMRSETECGDAWALFADKEQFSLMVADGLGHGPLAAEASEQAVKTFVANPQLAPVAFLQNAHQALAGTRGAAVAIASMNFSDNLLKYAGLGNISGTLLSTSNRVGLCSHNGIIGVQIRKYQEFSYPREGREFLVMHSDGLQSRWTFDNYPGLMQHHPAVMASVLYRDFERGRDDVTVVVVRFGPFSFKV